MAWLLGQREWAGVLTPFTVLKSNGVTDTVSKALTAIILVPVCKFLNVKL